ncbi:MAG: polyhydroxyalkanoate depolymerase [Alphaproteobacteria bacterium]|nr:polyhydroxyalkanoate depolymerase [Alphaproteobacteria bacterium]
MAMMFENAGLYSLKEMHHAGMTPTRMMANAAKVMFSNPLNPMSYTGIGRQMAAAGELVERVTQSYPKPEFGLAHTNINGKHVEVWEEVALEKPFCRLLHFKREGNVKGEKLLLVAPMSGHYATLLRGTVEALLPHHDVYITDWQNARDIPLFKGTFDLNTYIDYLVEFLDHIGPNTHTMAVCQPSVPLFAAVAIMNENKHPCTPRSMTLMGGPVDTRKAPTKVNLFSQEHSIEWFESNVITRVPLNYPGFARRVYPGFLQLAGFMSMNFERHAGEHAKLFKHITVGDGEAAQSHRDFYNEYLAVADLPAEFYLQTIEEVFHKHSLPEGQFYHYEQRVRPDAITKTAILAIEGELDDISGLGHTKAALEITSKLAEGKKKYHMAPAVGHYGIFNGRKWREQVRPIITDWIEKNS